MSRPIQTPPPVAVAMIHEDTQVGIRLPGALGAAHIERSRAYSFVIDPNGQPVELGSGRFAKAYLGEERWLESKTAFRRDRKSTRLNSSHGYISYAVFCLKKKKKKTQK